MPLKVCTLFEKTVGNFLNLTVFIRKRNEFKLL
jgi:hypothetical protein